MDLEARKISFVQEFLRLQNEEIISILENTLHKNKSELTGKGFEPITITQFNKEIDKALEDSNNNRVIKASELKAKINKWS